MTVRTRATTQSEHSERGSNKATARVLRVLSAFACDEPVFGVTELSNRLGLTKNLVFRALGTLIEQGYLVRDASGKRYELGYGIVELINPNVPPPDFRSLAEPCMESLQALTRETVQLSIRVNDHSTVIDGIEGAGPVVVRSKLGMPMPLHASAASRAILSCLTDDQVQAYIDDNAPLERFTENTITEPAKLWDEVHLVRKRGYAVGYADFTRSGSSVSFAIPDAEGVPHGAITVGGPIERFPESRIAEVLPDVLSIIENLRAKAALYYAD